MKICGGTQIKAEKDEFFQQAGDRLGRPDYGKLENAYSGMTRKLQLNPRILFEIEVSAYITGAYLGRKIGN